MPTEHTPRFLPIASLVIAPDRQRQEFDGPALLDLAGSIAEHDLLHAIVVRPDGKTLVAGERRVRAISTHLYPLGKTFKYNGVPVPLGTVPVIEVSATDPLALEEIELAENTRRQDLTWQELAATNARIHQIKQARAAKMFTEATGETPDQAQVDVLHPVSKTAELVRPNASAGHAHMATRAEILVAKHLDDPEVAKQKTVGDALKVLVQREKEQRFRELGVSVGKQFSANDLVLEQVDCIEWLRAYTGPKFDVLLTDPPYGMGAQDFSDGGGKLAQIEHDYDDSYEAWQELMAAWVPEVTRVMAEQAHAYVFCDIDRFHELKKWFQLHGWDVFRTPLIDYKLGGGRVPRPEVGPRRAYEIILYAILGNKPVNSIKLDVIPCKGDEQMGHGAQKPVELFSDLLSRSVKPGDRVLDCFGGTGPTLEACFLAKCYGTVLEKNSVSYGMAATRLRRLSAQPDLPGMKLHDPD